MNVRSLISIAVAALTLSTASPSFAQFGGGFGGPAPPGRGAKPDPKKDPNQPETHAASGSGDETIPKTTTSEPALPADPLSMTDATKKRIGTSADKDVPQGTTQQRTYTLIPPYLEEKSGQYRFRTIFPVWAEREQPGDTASVYGMAYYRRRSLKLDADVLFPLFWKWREDKDNTTIVGPFGRHTGPDATDTFFAPLFFHGTRKDGFYLTIPPLLTSLKTDAHGGHSVVGPGFCFWKGGSTCNPETADSISYGIFPLYFAGKDEHTRYELALPLLHYYRYEELDQSWLNVYGPVVRAHWPDKEAFHVAPFYLHTWGANEDHVTIPPLLFHYGYKGNSNLLVTPLFIKANGEKGEKTFVTWGYARHRGRTELDMITPFYWRYEDPDAKLERKILFPFLYSSQSPRESNVAFFPFYAHFRRYGLSETTFITPLFSHTKSVTGWETNLYPLVWVGRDREHSHTVVAPFFFDFVTPSSRTTIGFPVFWRFQEGNTVSQLVLNTYYREKKLRTGLDWEFHVFPFFSYGESPNGHFWNVLFGLAGYSRSGAATKMRVFWAPITLSEDAK